MRFIRNYGTSVTQQADDNTALKRHLRPYEQNQGDKTMAAHFQNLNLILAQWASELDKIATKPSGDKKPTRAQLNFRNLLNHAFWARMIQSHSELDNKDFKKKWRTRVHPYGFVKEYEAKRRTLEARRYNFYYDLALSEKGKPRKQANKLTKKDVNLIADAVQAQLSLTNPNGLSNQRQRAIENSVLSLTPPTPQGPKGKMDYRKDHTLIKESHWHAYLKPSPAGLAARLLEMVPAKLQPKEKFDRIGSYIKIAQAINAHFRLHEGIEVGHDNPIAKCHQLVKAYYKETVKTSGKNHTTLAHTLPKTDAALLKVLNHRISNKERAHLLRVGRILHYGGSAPLTQSAWLRADKQAEIKRNETFIRLWRTALAFAARTLKDWADPDNVIKKDILGSGVISKQITIGTIKNYDEKTRLLFGTSLERETPYLQFDDDNKNLETVQTLTKTALKLRHEIFHFKSIKDLKKQLEKELPNIGTESKNSIKEEIANAAARLYRDDHTRQRQILADQLKAAQCGSYLNPETYEKVWDRLTAAGNTEPDLPLPRFNRILKRADNVKANDQTWLRDLPPAATQRSLEGAENAGALCRFVVLKALYEGPFRGWLAEKDNIRSHCIKALNRIEVAAQKITNSKDPTPSGLRRLLDADNSDTPLTALTFTQKLSAETASASSLTHSHYTSNRDNTKSHSEKVEALKADVFGLAFLEYLNEQGLQALCRPLSQQHPTSTPFSPTSTETTRVGKPWQHKLYLILHLIPVDVVSQLLHQLRKRETLTSAEKILKSGGEHKEDTTFENLGELIAPFTLYLTCHDAKFSGGAAFEDIAAFKSLYEEDAYQALYKQDNAETATLIPRRGLREIARFGDVNRLLPLIEKHQGVITLKEVQDWQNSKGKVDTAQQTLEDLHKKMQRSKNPKAEDLKAYQAALDTVARQRDLTRKIMLQDAARLHHVMMQYIGRLIDFTGHWERDCKFIIKAEQAKELNPNGHFPIALYKDEDDHQKIQKLRNHFAHFKMLEEDKKPNLTDEANKARALMAYDRKMKNAIGKALRDLMDRNGLTLDWTMQNHQYVSPKVTSRVITHFNQIEKKNKDKCPKENFHTDKFCAMVQALFEKEQSLQREEEK